MGNKPAPNPDLHDSENDRKHLQPEETILDLPDVEDIPGQENIRPPKFREMADITASSADEEGDELFGDESDELSEGGGKPSRVSRTEKRLLRDSALQTPGDESESDARGASLDRRDADGDPLNEGDLETDRFGEDLDIPESEEVEDEDSSD